MKGFRFHSSRIKLHVQNIQTKCYFTFGKVGFVVKFQQSERSVNNGESLIAIPNRLSLFDICLDMLSLKLHQT